MHPNARKEGWFSRCAFPSSEFPCSCVRFKVEGKCARNQSTLDETTLLLSQAWILVAWKFFHRSSLFSFSSWQWLENRKNGPTYPKYSKNTFYLILIGLLPGKKLNVCRVCFVYAHWSISNPNAFLRYTSASSCPGHSPDDFGIKIMSWNATACPAICIYIYITVYVHYSWIPQLFLALTSQCWSYWCCWSSNFILLMDIHGLRISMGSLQICVCKVQNVCQAAIQLCHSILWLIFLLIDCHPLVCWGLNAHMHTETQPIRQLWSGVVRKSCGYDWICCDSTSLNRVQPCHL